MAYSNANLFSHKSNVGLTWLKSRFHQGRVPPWRLQGKNLFLASSGFWKLPTVFGSWRLPPSSSQRRLVKPSHSTPPRPPLCLLHLLFRTLMSLLGESRVISLFQGSRLAALILSTIFTPFCMQHKRIHRSPELGCRHL